MQFRLRGGLYKPLTYIKMNIYVYFIYISLFHQNDDF